MNITAASAISAISNLLAANCGCGSSVETSYLEGRHGPYAVGKTTIKPAISAATANPHAGSLEWRLEGAKKPNAGPLAMEWAIVEDAAARGIPEAVRLYEAMFATEVAA